MSNINNPEEQVSKNMQKMSIGVTKVKGKRENVAVAADLHKEQPQPLIRFRK